MVFVYQLKHYYTKTHVSNFMYNDESEIAKQILDFLKKKQHIFNYKIEYEYPIYPNQINKGIGDIRITFNNVIFVIELKVIHSNRSCGSGKTERTSRNKKRNKVIQQAIYYAKATKKDFPNKSVIPISITDEKIDVHSEVSRQTLYPWETNLFNMHSSTPLQIQNEYFKEFPSLSK